MKKIILLVAVLFIVQLSFSQIQSGEITYKVTTTADYHHWKDSILDANDNEMAVQFVKKTMKKNEKALPFLELSLAFNSSASLFDKPNTLDSDGGVDLNRAASGAGMSGVYYTNTDERILLHQFEGIENNWLVRSSLDSLDWKISNETKEIQGYQCRKATTTVDLNSIKKGEIVAWFAPALPFQFGPMGSAGLPGMILGLERNHRYFYADKIKLSEQKKNIKTPTKGKAVSLTEYNQAMKDWEEKRLRE